MITRAKSKKLQEQQLCAQEQARKESARVADKLEAVVFEEFHVFEGQNHLDIEGLRYEDIDRNEKQKQYLESLRSNLPKYSTMSSQQKASYFKKISRDYVQKFQPKPAQARASKPKKLVSFETEEKYVAFDKNHSPSRVKFLEESYDLTKF